MSQRMLDDLSRAATCVALLHSLGARVQTTFVGAHGPTITLAEAGTLVDHLDRERQPITCTGTARIAELGGCLVAWVNR